VQVQKPDPRIFTQALAEIGYGAADTWFVGDDPLNDVLGAAAVGLRVAAAIDPHTISRALDTRAGSNVTNHDDKHVDALIDRMREAAAEEALRQVGDDFQHYVVENMITTSISSFGFLQAARGYVKGYENLHGYKLRFETTWLDK
jgi:ABC-type transport system substrate-binding protein